MKYGTPSIALTYGLLIGATAIAAPVDATATIPNPLDIVRVWSGHPVRFSLLTHPPHQFVAFYGADRQMTVAHRLLDSSEWLLVRLPEKLGWDSHNSVTMALDDEGHLHLSGNMHCVPLIYFRTSRAYDITSFKRIPHMVRDREDRCTYPHFFRGHQNKLVFTYRDGSSGNGDQIYNVYDLETRNWTRLLDQPLTSGQGQMNAYLHGPKRGPDGYFHLSWVWRDTPDCATNHDPCYARSLDLVHWESSKGESLPLPITLETAEIVDPVPAGGGVINGNVVLGFDSSHRPVVSYHKFDADGNTQIYNARREAGGWHIYRASDWDYRWEFHGGGSIPFAIRVGAVQVAGDGRLAQAYHHPTEGSGAWILDEHSMAVIEERHAQRPQPRQQEHLESSFPGMKERTCGDLGTSGDPSLHYQLRWETLGVNRDRPREGTLPPPSMLRLYQLVR